MRGADSAGRELLDGRERERCRDAARRTPATAPVTVSADRRMVMTDDTGMVIVARARGR